MLDQINETVHHLKESTGFQPAIGLVLGSGLGALADRIESPQVVPYGTIPHFPVPTVDGHNGNLIMGMLGGRPVVAMQGRFHFYEGYSLQEVVFPIRVMKGWGVHDLVLSNAAGGVNPDFAVGDLMFIEDHINLMGVNPLTGRNDEHLGPRFPDMSAPYDRDRISRARKIADRMGIRNHTGVYAAVTGPCYETPAEYRYLQVLGADAVGMSTVPEAIAARHMNLTCFAVSVITDLGGGPVAHPVSHDDVVRAAAAVEEKLTALLVELITQF